MIGNITHTAHGAAGDEGGIWSFVRTKTTCGLLRRGALRERIDRRQHPRSFARTRADALGQFLFINVVRVNDFLLKNATHLSCNADDSKC
jgi:hypothetical protein